jgi:hypothetical protein
MMKELFIILARDKGSQGSTSGLCPKSVSPIRTSDQRYMFQNESIQGWCRSPMKLIAVMLY